MTLALDCSVSKITLALIRDQKICSFYNEVPPDSQAKSIITVIEDVLKGAGAELIDVQKVLFCHGPGSFTSLRIGLATLMGLFWGREVQMFQMSSLLCRCYSLLNYKRDCMVSVIPVGRKRFATGILNQKKVNKKYLEAVLSIDDFIKQVKELPSNGVVSGKDLGFLSDHLKENGPLIINEDLVLPEAFVCVDIEKHYDIISLQDCQIKYMVNPDTG